MNRKCNSKSNSIQAVIFDMDGVLVESETVNYHAMLETLKPFNISFDFSYYSQFPGGSCIEAFNKIKADYNANFDTAKSVVDFNNTRRTVAKRDGWQAVPGAVDAVRYCADKYKLALASGSAIDIIKDVTSTFNIDDCFLSMISGESIEHCKPAPDIFLKSAENIGVKPENCAVVEDSHNGVLAAKAANMTCIGFVNPNSGNQDLSVADFIISDMVDVKKYL